jgi:hypothetical protein
MKLPTSILNLKLGEGEKKDETCSVARVRVKYTLYRSTFAYRESATSALDGN